jgi:hypothetical protein
MHRKQLPSDPAALLRLADELKTVLDFWRPVADEIRATGRRPSPPHPRPMLTLAAGYLGLPFNPADPTGQAEHAFNARLLDPAVGDLSLTLGQALLLLDDVLAALPTDRSPGTPAAKGTVPADEQPSSPAVTLGGQNDKPRIRGKATRRLSPPRYNVIKALLGVWPKSLNKDQLVQRSGHRDAVNILGRLKRCKTLPEWETAIEMAEITGVGYRIADA